MSFALWDSEANPAPFAPPWEGARGRERAGKKNAGRLLVIVTPARVASFRPFDHQRRDGLHSCIARFLRS